MSRDQLLHKVRTALGRSAGQEPGPPPPVRIRIPQIERTERIAMFRRQLELLAGKTESVRSYSDAAGYVERVLAGRDAVASGSAFLVQCGITALAGVRSGFTSSADLRAACATCAVGITSADYALADTGTLVMLAGPDQARMVSLLPPVHIAILPASRLLTSLDELLSIVPDPAQVTSAMVLITGPSRTADIEQILVRGVHGPGEIYVIILEE